MSMSAATTSLVSLDLLEDLVREAGHIALEFFGRDPQVWSKGDDSPVCEADLAVDAFLRRTLLANHPDFAWVSEESASTPHRGGDGPAFVVDPIDGTRAFIRGDSEWAVSVGVIADSRPVAGVLYCPRLDELFRAEAGAGAELNGETIAVRSAPSPHEAKAAGPRAILNDRAFFDLSLQVHAGGPSLAYRLAQVADGRLDIAVARSNSHDWDLAAVDLLVHEAGGLLTGIDGAPIRYNEGSLRHPALICAPAAYHADLRGRLAAVLE